VVFSTAGSPSQLILWSYIQAFKFQGEFNGNLPDHFALEALHGHDRKRETIMQNSIGSFVGEPPTVILAALLSKLHLPCRRLHHHDREECVCGG